jgi:viroplasmin and RNaseH domain-containing protein
MDIKALYVRNPSDYMSFATMEQALAYCAGVWETACNYEHTEYKGIDVYHYESATTAYCTNTGAELFHIERPNVEDGGEQEDYRVSSIP